MPCLAVTVADTVARRASDGSSSSVTGGLSFKDWIASANPQEILGIVAASVVAGLILFVFFNTLFKCAVRRWAPGFADSIFVSRHNRSIDAAHQPHNAVLARRRAAQRFQVVGGWRMEDVEFDGPREASFELQPWGHVAAVGGDNNEENRDMPVDEQGSPVMVRQNVVHREVVLPPLDADVSAAAAAVVPASAVDVAAPVVLPLHGAPVVAANRQRLPSTPLTAESPSTPQAPPRVYYRRRGHSNIRLYNGNPVEPAARSSMVLGDLIHRREETAAQAARVLQQARDAELSEDQQRTIMRFLGWDEEQEALAGRARGFRRATE